MRGSKKGISQEIMKYKRAVIYRPIHIKVILTKTIKTLDKIADLCYNKSQLKVN